MRFISAKPKKLNDQVEIFQNVSIGETFNMVCPFENFDNIAWFKDGMKLQSLEANFSIRNISLNDNGTYTCEASNLAGKEQFNTTIIVHFSSIVSLQYDGKDWNDTSIDVILSHRFEIHCMADGYPTPKVMTIWDQNIQIHKMIF